MLQFIQDEIKKIFSLLSHIHDDQHFLNKIVDIANACVRAFSQGKKIMLAGNGGSAADAQHLATELVTRLQYERPGLCAIALTTDTSILTACGNDYSFEKIFSRQIEALGQAGDVFIGISTSGKSPNVLAALTAARSKNLTTIGFSGEGTPSFNESCDYTLNIPSKETQKIQECHIVIGHILCALIEESIFGEKYNPALQNKKNLVSVSS